MAVMNIASMFEYNCVDYKEVDDKDVESLDKGMRLMRLPDGASQRALSTMRTKECLSDSPTRTLGYSLQP
jgi:hypothetical protein